MKYTLFYTKYRTYLITTIYFSFLNFVKTSRFIKTSHRLTDKVLNFWCKTATNKQRGIDNASESAYLAAVTETNRQFLSSIDFFKKYSELITRKNLIKGRVSDVMNDLKAISPICQIKLKKLLKIVLNCSCIYNTFVPLTVR